MLFIFLKTMICVFPAGLTYSVYFHFQYSDTPPPYIQCSPDINIELPPNKLSAYVKIPQPKSNVDWWRYVEAHPPWAKALEGEFQLGSTSIMFQARNPTTNLTAACRLLINVYDNEKPQVIECPESFIVRLSAKETGKIVTWKEPIFSDNVKIEQIEKSKESGSIFRPGYYPIRYTARDSSGNEAMCNFTVTVKYDEKATHAENKDSFRRVIICPHLIADGELYPSYTVPARCFIQRHRLTRVLSGFTDYQPFQNHGVRHQHDRVTVDSRIGLMRNYYPKRRDNVRDEAKLTIKSEAQSRKTGVGESTKIGETLTVAVPKHQSNVQNSYHKNGTIFMDTQLLIDQKNHQSDLARWQEIVKKYHTPALPPVTGSSRESSIRLLELETRTKFEEERMRDHEAEMMKWREDMKKYHLEMKRLQEDSRRYRAG